jgi:Resolvase, N terminal domain
MTTAARIAIGVFTVVLFGHLRVRLGARDNDDVNIPTGIAREKYDHFALRSHLKSLGMSLRSATEPIDDTATGKLMEGVLASFAQFDNDVRSDRFGRTMKIWWPRFSPGGPTDELAGADRAFQEGCVNQFC